ncbi:MAG: hypothetical protein LBS53_02835 [Synergistaceae bacterium]|jgi:hypothetical protein|nr:hypothetical protein [Synergistaceae bacterium]
MEKYGIAWKTLLKLSRRGMGAQNAGGVCKVCPRLLPAVNIISISATDRINLSPSANVFF